MEKKKNNTELDLDEDGIPKLEYIQVGEFLLPNLSLEKVDGYIGRWGIMRKEYLQKHKPAVYSSMLLMDELNQHLIDIQKTADERMDVLEKQLLERDPAPDKAKDGMAWTRHMNQIRHQAEEYVKSEIIFNLKREIYFSMIVPLRNEIKVAAALPYPVAYAPGETC